MPVKLTDFADPLLHRLTVCCKFSDCSLMPEFRDSKIDVDAVYGDEHWCRLLIDVQEADDTPATLHFHVDTVRRFDVTKKTPATSTIEDIESKINRFQGQQGPAWIYAQFKIPEKELPQRGIISTLLGVSMDVGDDSLTLTGGKISIESTTFDEMDLAWRLDSEGRVVISLDANLKPTIDDNYVCNVETLLRSALDRFVLPSQEGES